MATFLRRLPSPALRPFVKVLWASDDTLDPEPKRAERELVLPTGTTHLAFRLAGDPLRVFDGIEGRIERVIGHAVVGGPRALAYVRDIRGGSRTVGAQLHAGAAHLLGGGAAELAGSHVRLEDLWGSSMARDAWQRLGDAQTLDAAVNVLEALLAARLPKLRGLHPAIAHALGRFAAEESIGAVVLESGYSHRRFATLFRDAVGLAPKQYYRVLRLQRAVELAASSPNLSLATVAASCGFGDQPHLCRDFRELVGISPGDYRRARPAHPNHVPLG